MRQRLYAQSTYGKDAATDSAHAVGATGVADAGRDAVIARRASMLQSLDSLVAAVDARLEGRAAKPGASGRMLRLVQVAQALDMTVKEVKCAQFVMLTCLGFKGGSRAWEAQQQCTGCRIVTPTTCLSRAVVVSCARHEQGVATSRIAGRCATQ